MMSISIPGINGGKRKVKNVFMISLIFFLLLSCLTSSSNAQPVEQPNFSQTVFNNYKAGLNSELNTDGSAGSLKTVTSQTYNEQSKNILELIAKTAKPIVWGNKSQTKLALTFDDGYDRSSIERTLNALRENKVKCTFFIIGDVLKTNQDLWKQAVKDGHQICNHTKSHKFLASASEEEVKQQIEGWELDVKDALGEDYFKRMKAEFPFFRFPGGIGDQNQRNLKIVSGMGYIPVSWSSETVYSVLRFHKLGYEPADPIAEQVKSHVIDTAQNGAIILLHFNPYDTLKIEDTIKGIRNKGMQIVTMSELVQGIK